MLQSKQSSLCGLHHSGDQGRGGPNGQIVSVKRTGDRRRERSREIIDEKREKYRAKNGSLQNTLVDSKRTTFMVFIDHASMSIRKERLSPTSKARREASQNEFIEKGRMPKRGLALGALKALGEISGREDRPRAWPGYVKPI